MKTFPLFLLPILILLALAYAFIPIKYLPPWSHIAGLIFLSVFLLLRWADSRKKAPHETRKNLLKLAFSLFFLLMAASMLVSEYISKDFHLPVWCSILAGILTLLAILNRKSLMGRSQTLYAASLTDDEDAVKRLISLGKYEVNSQDERGNTALMGATISGNKNLVNYLLQRGAVPNQLNNEGRSAMHEAITFEHPGLLKLLLQHGGNSNLLDEDSTSLLQDACFDDNVPAAEILLSQRAEINYQDSDGWTALMFAVEMENIKTIKFLLEQRADTSLKNNDGESAHELAKKAENPKIAKLFP